MKHLMYKQLISIILSISLVGTSTLSSFAQYSFLAAPGEMEVNASLIKNDFTGGKSNISKKSSYISMNDLRKTKGRNRTRKKIIRNDMTKFDKSDVVLFFLIPFFVLGSLFIFGVGILILNESGVNALPILFGSFMIIEGLAWFSSTCF